MAGNACIAIPNFFVTLISLFLIDLRELKIV